MGLDLSITNTGIVVFNGKRVLHESLIRTTNADVDEVRIAMVARAVVRVWKEYKPIYTGIENYAYSRPQQMARLGELSGVVKNKLWRLEAPWYPVNNKTARKTLCGNGNATKAQVVEAAQTFVNSNDENIADAFAIANQVWNDQFA